jgi:hypothetical protein
MRHANGRFRNQRTHPGVGVAHPHAEAAKNVAGQIDHTNVKLALGKPPLPKKAFTDTPEIHSAMMGKARSDGTHFAGLSGQDLSRYDADPSGLDTVSVVEGPPRGKALSPVQPSFGQRDRTNDALSSGVPGAAHKAAMLSRDEFTKGMVEISKDVLDQAANARGSDAFDRARFGKLPDSTTEGGG